MGIKNLKQVKPKNKIQKQFLTAIDEKPIVFALGSAGTGKTYLSAYKALEELGYNFVEKIVLVRPSVATENLGFLPGDFNEKLDPYLFPLFDCLIDISNSQYIKQLKEREQLIIAPLAFMRGRTFSNSFIILDEAQNTTISQMKLFLTRFGENVRVCITGDLSQSDLNGDNGLKWALERLKDCDSVEAIHYSSDYVVRSELAAELIKYLE